MDASLFWQPAKGTPGGCCWCEAYRAARGAA